MRKVIASAFVSLDGVMQPRAGLVKTASFALETPTEAETARRERMLSEG